MEPVIPIQNLYFIFCYAWKKLEESKAVEVGAVDSPELADLFAKVLISGLEHIIRRGIDRGYLPIREELYTLRGRINVYDSMKQSVRRSPRLVCEHDELSPNILTNRIIKTTIRRLMNTSGLDQEHAHQLRVLLKSFEEIDELRLSTQAFRQVQIHRNNSFYSFLISICELIYDFTLPEGNGKSYKFSDIVRDEVRMRLVFQDFVKNFFAIESDFVVTPLSMKWDATSDNEEELNLLPSMTTDIHLGKGDRRIIVDTKYYKESLQEHFGKQSIHSAHLYQLFSYLKNAEPRGPEYLNAEGILLYPAVGEKLSFKAEIQGHSVRVCSIKLDQPWQMIKSDLLNLLLPQ